MTDNQRIEEIKKYLGLSARALSQKLGLKGPQIFYDIKAGKCGISKDLAFKIQDIFFMFNLNWLLTGEGEMLKSEHRHEEGNITDVSFIPLLPISAQGGSLNDFVVSVHTSECEHIISPIAGADFAMPIAGDSMAPEYPSGSQVLVKKINERAFIEWGKTYVVDTCNGTIIKILMPTDRDDVVKCVSINENYPPFEVNLLDIHGIYRVMMVMSLK